jgi:glycosyltransferase involved in cell wall biosynthesis
VVSDPAKVIVVMPAYNAETTLERTFRDIPDGSVDEVILVDDGSQDDTVELARNLGITVIEHSENRGYGANQKTCYREALERGADIVVMIHPDYQYDSSMVPAIVELLDRAHCDVILGNRIRSRREALQGGMPVYKYLANRGLTIIENLWTGENLGEWHSGMRAYKREVLETIPWENNSDDFVFDSQFLLQAVHFGFHLGDLPVPVRYMREASSINFSRSLEYGMLTFEVFVRWTLHKWKWRKDALFTRESSSPPM